MFRHVVEAVVELDAPPQRVFDALTRADAWGAWSTMLVFQGGRLAKGERVKLGLRTSAASYDFEALVTELQPNACFEWLAKTGVTGLFDGRHRFELTALPGARTRLRNVEFYTGLLVPVISRLAMMKTAPEGFRAMNEELRVHVETPDPTR